jgi:uncharacterized repeat protein (TIGR01451 family)
LTWTTSSPGATIVNGILFDELGDLGSGATGIIHVSAATTTANCGVLTDTATVTSSNNDPASLFSTANITVNCPNLSIAKSADQPTINAGETAAFTITVSNAGPGDAHDVVVNDPLPTGVNWTTTTMGASIVVGVLTDNIGTLAANGTAVIHVSGATTSANCGTLTDTATVTSSNNDPESLDSTATVAVLCPGLEMAKTADQPVINAGDVAGFTITVRNTGPGAALGA